MGLEQIPAHRLIGVADVFRHQRQQDFFAAAVRHFTREQMKQKEKRSLATCGHGAVFRSDLPPQFAAQHLRESLQESRIAARRIIIAEDFFHFIAMGHHLMHPLAPADVHLRNVRRLSASQHPDLATTGRKRMTEVVHQFGNPARSAESKSHL